MLALKVHRDKKPNIGRGTFWIPIVDWRSAKVQLSTWYRILSHKRMHHVTLARIPDDHPVFVGVDWTARICLGLRPKTMPFKPMREIESAVLNALKPLKKALAKGEVVHVGQGYLVPGPWEAGRPLAECPELVLGAALPKAQIKWTKDIRLLLRGDKRDQSRRKARSRLDRDE